MKSFTEVQNFAPGSPNAFAKGDLTIRGITKPAEVKFFFTPGENGFEAKGKLVIDRTKFGLKYNSKQFFDMKKLGDKLIDDNFEVDLNLVAKR
jgi:polyisoprenoid-binding protein YceI